MITLDSYIFEDDDKKDDDATKERSEIQFSIWQSDGKKLDGLKDNKGYQKIEYDYINKKDGIKICFLLGFNDNEWKLWVGKIGVCNYEDEPYKSLKTDKFYEAVVKSLDIIQEFIKMVKDDKDNWVQYYINL